MEETEKKKKGRPRKNSRVQENGTPADTAVSENIADGREGEKKQKTRRTVRAKKSAAGQKADNSDVLNIEQNNGLQAEPTKNTSAKKAGRKAAKTDKKSLAESPAKEVSSEAAVKAAADGTDKKISGKKTAAGCTEKKSTVSRGRKRKNSEQNTGEKTAQLAIDAQNRLAIEAVSDIKSLPQHDAGHAVPAELGGKDLAVYKKGQLAVAEKNLPLAVQDTEKKQDAGKASKTKKTAPKKGRKTAKTQKNSAVSQEPSVSKRGRKKRVKDTADFVAGVNGIAEYNGEETLSAFGEQAGLGVFGVIEEAPVVEAVLPLVQEADKANKRTRKRGRKKKQQKENAAAVDFETSPIVEDGEIARIEAEESLRKAKRNKKEAPKAEKKEHIRRVLYVSTVPDEQVEVVITENGIVSEYFVEMAHHSKIRGNIYKGVINNVDTNLQAAFVNFGCGKNGFLQIDEVHPEYYLAPHDEGSSKYPPIQKVLKVGQEVLVQVVKEPNGTKGAFLTTWISLAGRFLVLTPGQEQIGVSRKVEDSEERQRLRALLNGIKPGENMGVIIRTASEGASKTHIQKDLQVLKRTWKNIQKQVVKSSAPSLVYQEADLATRAVRDYLNEDIDEVWVDSKDVQKSVAELIKILFPKNKEMLQLHDDPRQTLWERFNIARQLEEVTKREVNLPSGGRLVFDQTEALMAIDINSGKSQGKNNFEAMVFRTNMEAVEAIARHLRLRDIGGQVVIDFIEMRDKNHCREVEKALHSAMKRDRARHDIGKLSSFGLLELVRQRTGSSVISITSEPCPHCRGTGFRRNLEWQAQGVLRDIRSKLAAKNVPSTYVHHVDQEIAFYILNKKRDRLSDLEHEFGVKIEIHLK